MFSSLQPSFHPSCHLFIPPTIFLSILPSFHYSNHPFILPTIFSSFQPSFHPSNHLYILPTIFWLFLPSYFIHFYTSYRLFILSTILSYSSHPSIINLFILTSIYSSFQPIYLYKTLNFSYNFKVVFVILNVVFEDSDINWEIHQVHICLIFINLR